MLRLKTFGGVSLERDGIPLEGRVTQRRRLALLAYLAAAGENSTNREKLIVLLWPERDDEHGRHSLSQAVYAVRQELGAEVLLGGIDEIRLNHGVLTSDVAEFIRAVGRGDGATAAELYRGPFLDGFYVDGTPEFERWTAEERDRLAAQCGGVLEQLAIDATRRGELAAALNWWRRRAGLSPLDARVTLRLMDALVAAGDRVGAIRQAQIHERLLRSELDMDPDPEVAGLAERLRHRSAPVASGVSLSPGPSGETVVASLPAPARSGRWRGPGWAALTLAAGFMLMLWLRPAPAPDPDHRILVLVGDFAGPDSTLSLAIQEAVRAELAAEPRVQVVPDGRVIEGLRLMRASPGIQLTPDVALHLAQRLGVHSVVVGTASPLGLGVQVTARVLRPSDGGTVVSLAERPEDDEQVVTAVSRLGRSLRTRIANVDPPAGVSPLPAVTTSSLEALKSYALARQALSRDRRVALSLGEAALAQDSVFPLAHYLVGDLLWFMDQQEHSDAHMARANALAARVPLRERLLIRARYEQLVQDRPDSALVYWQLLRASYPDEPLAYEGMAWTLRALGDYAAAAAAADTALQLDPSAVTPNVNNRLYALMSLGDTAGALGFVSRLGPGSESPQAEARYLAALQRKDWPGALALIDTASQGPGRLYRAHIALLAMGRLDDARTVLDSLAAGESARAQLYPRGLILQGIAEAEAGRLRRAATLAQQAQEWLDRADLSPPAIVEGARRLVDARDAGRSLRSYRLAGLLIEACSALLARDPRRALELIVEARSQNYFARSASTGALVEAQARAETGDRAGAARLYAAVSSHALPDTDFEAWPVLGVLAARRLTR